VIPYIPIPLLFPAIPVPLPFPVKKYGNGNRRGVFPPVPVRFQPYEALAVAATARTTGGVLIVSWAEKKQKSE